jgi:hypothetical protein
MDPTYRRHVDKALGVTAFVLDLRTAGSLNVLGGALQNAPTTPS